MIRIFLSLSLLLLPLAAQSQNAAFQLADLGAAHGKADAAGSRNSPAAKSSKKVWWAVAGLVAVAAVIAIVASSQSSGSGGASASGGY